MSLDIRDDLDRAMQPCEDCTPNLRWEKRDVSTSAEAWLGMCALCGSMRVLVLGADDIEVEDPLTYFLTGVPKFEPAPATPAWQRFYARTIEPPFNLRWRFQSHACDTCEARSSLGVSLRSPRGTRSLTLCLNCGRVCVETVPSEATAAPILLTGNQWSPPDPAVKTLRAAVFGSYYAWVTSLEEWRRRRQDGPQ